MRTRLLVGLLSLAAFAGCLDDDDTAVAARDGPAADAKIHNETASGDATTTSVLWIGGLLLGEGAEFQVLTGASKLIVNITAQMITPTEFNVRFAEDGCDTLADTCAHFVDLQRGEGQFTVERPSAGTWSVAFFTDMGVAVGTYDLEIVQFIASSDGNEDGEDEDEPACEPETGC